VSTQQSGSSDTKMVSGVLKMSEWTKEPHWTKQAEQYDSNEYRAGTSMWYRSVLFKLFCYGAP